MGGGAQIVPSEVALDPAKPDKAATFYLTPLALGWLPGVRVEVVHQGRKVQEIPLPCKTVRQRGTLLFHEPLVWVGAAQHEVWRREPLPIAKPAHSRVARTMRTA